MSWTSVQIEKTCLPTRIRDPRDAPEASFRYVDISSIDRDLKTITSTSEIMGKDAPSRARKEIRAGNILVSTVRPNLNAVAIVPPELDGHIASTGFCVLQPNSQMVDGKYLFYFTLTPNFIGVLSSRVRGAHYPAVSDREVKEIELPLPFLSEQHRIVEILDQADMLRKKRARADAKAARIIPALFYKMFGDPATNPKRFHVEPLEEVTSLIHRYPTFYGVDYVTNGVPVARISDIMENGVLNRCLDAYVRVPEEFSNQFPLTLLEAYDIVMAVRGDTTGKIGLVPPEVKGANLSPNLIRISPRMGKIQPLYLFTFLILARAILGQFITNTAKKSITAANLKSLPVIVPDEQKQKGFQEMVKPLLEVEQNRQTAEEAIDSIFNTLLHRAFTGELTAKWREAHMKELFAEIKEQAKYLDVAKKGNL